MVQNWGKDNTLIIIIISLFNVHKKKKVKNTVKIIKFTIYETT